MDHKLSFQERVYTAPEVPNIYCVRLEPNVHIEHRRGGTLIDMRDFHNLVTNAGMAGVAARINGSGTPAAYTWVGIGTVATAADPTDTTLAGEITTNGGQRKQDASPTVATSTVTNDTAVVDVTYTFTGGFTVRESGLFNADYSGGTLLARQTFADLGVISGDSLTITWKIIVG